MISDCASTTFSNCVTRIFTGLGDVIGSLNCSMEDLIDGQWSFIRSLAEVEFEFVEKNVRAEKAAVKGLIDLGF